MGNNRLMDHFFQLLRYAIGASDEFPEDISREEWREIHELAHRQAILGVLLYGIQKNAALRIDRDLLLRWFAESEQIRHRNGRLDEATVTVAHQLEEDGFKVCVLKGQGNARLYPDKSIRTPGDVDIWPLVDRNTIYQYVRRRFHDTEMLYHHLEYPVLNDVMTEIHFFPMFLNNPIYNKRFQKWTWKMVADNHLMEVTNDYGSYWIPDNNFNMVCQLAHIRHHFFDEGIGLRQVVDYFFLLRGERCEVRGEREDVKCKMYDVKWEKEEGRGERLALRDTLRWLGMEKFAGALMWVLSEVLGLEEQYLVAEPNEKLGRMLLDEILMTGNFGQHDNRFGSLKQKSRMTRLCGLLQKNFKFLVYYPDEVICGFLFRAIGQPLWRLWWRKFEWWRVESLEFRG